MAKIGETVILTNVVMGNQDRNDLDFFPLLVDYEEKYYAAGKITAVVLFVENQGQAKLLFF